MFLEKKEAAKAELADDVHLAGVYVSQSLRSSLRQSHASTIESAGQPLDVALCLALQQIIREGWENRGAWSAVPANLHLESLDGGWAEQLGGGKI